MFSKETYIIRREKLKKYVGSGILLFLGNEETGLNYRDNAFRYRQDSTFLYFFGLKRAGLAAIIDIDNNKEIIFGDELTIDDIVWMGNQPQIIDEAIEIGVKEVQPYNNIYEYLKKGIAKNQTVHYLPTYRAEHQIKLNSLLNVPIGT